MVGVWISTDFDNYWFFPPTSKHYIKRVVLVYHSQDFADGRSPILWAWGVLCPVGGSLQAFSRFLPNSSHSAHPTTLPSQNGHMDHSFVISIYGGPKYKKDNPIFRGGSAHTPGIQAIHFFCFLVTWIVFLTLMSFYKHSMETESYHSLVKIKYCACHCSGKEEERWDPIHCKGIQWPDHSHVA